MTTPGTIKAKKVGKLRVVGNCPCDECKTGVAGTTIQIQDSEGWVTIPVKDIKRVAEAMLKVIA